MLRVGEGEELGALVADRVDRSVNSGVGIGVRRHERAVAVFILIQQQLEQHPQVTDLAGPLLARHLEQVTVGELTERLKQGAGVKRAEEELASKTFDCQKYWFS